MHLILDIGNTRVKAAIFDTNRLIDLSYFPHENLIKEIRTIHNEYAIQNGIVAAVGLLKKNDVSIINTLFPLLEFNQKTSVPFKNQYATPESLGVDRMALAAAAIEQFPHENVLIIDSGTCITYDYITEKGNYKGGAIAPGITTRYKSLKDYTDKLPLLDKKIPKSFIGNSTEESIHSGVINGICREIDGIIEQYKKLSEKLTVVLTGGDAEFLSSQLKNSIFVRPFFLVEGLFTILKYNTQ